MMPAWLQPLAIALLALAGLCSLIIAAHVVTGHRQRMWITNIVWPVTALYLGPLALWAYFSFGPKGKEKPFWQIAAVAATHCGSGCTLGDIIASWIFFAAPLTLFGERIFGEWLVDYLWAYGFGIGFQYFTIAPMRRLGVRAGLVAAIEADTLSLTAWQAGMYGWMAVVHFGFFGEIPKTDPVFWFMMQIGMAAGFLTSYPVNRWLLKAGLKERM